MHTEFDTLLVSFRFQLLLHTKTIASYLHALMITMKLKKKNPLVPIIRLISKAKLTCHLRGNCEPISFGTVTPYIFKNVILNSEVHF